MNLEYCVMFTPSSFSEKETPRLQGPDCSAELRFR